MPQVADTGSKRLVSLAPDAWVRWITGEPDVVARDVLGEEFQWISRASDMVTRAHSPRTGDFAMVCEVQLRRPDRMRTIFDPERLKQLHRRAVQVPALDDFLRELDEE